jgi:DNA-binding CsgD family transcriptional regulator
MAFISQESLMAHAAEQLDVLVRGLARHREISATAPLSAAELGRVLDYSEALLCAPDAEVFMTLLQSVADWLELDKMLVAYGRDRHDIERARILSVREQPGWMRLYMRERFHEVDPLLAHADAGVNCFAAQPLLRFDSYASGLPLELRIRVRRLADAATDFRRADHGLAGAIGEEGKSKLFYTVVPQDRRQSHESSRLAALLGRLLPSIHAGLALLEVRDPLRIECSGPALSTKERETLALLAEGCNDREIASRLRIVEATVRFHLKRIFAKLGAQNRTHAVSIAHRLGLTSAER